jgi:hypothetical protein
MSEQVVYGDQVAREHKNDAPYERPCNGGAQVSQKEVRGNAGEINVEYDEPVPRYIEGEKKIEYVRRIKNAWL